MRGSVFGMNFSYVACCVDLQPCRKQSIRDSAWPTLAWIVPRLFLWLRCEPVKSLLSHSPVRGAPPPGLACGASTATAWNTEKVWRSFRGCDKATTINSSRPPNSVNHQVQTWTISHLKENSPCFRLLHFAFITQPFGHWSLVQIVNHVMMMTMTVLTMKTVMQVLHDYGRETLF